LQSAIEGLMRIEEACAELSICTVVGLPLAVDGRIFNCAALVGTGMIKGIGPKTCLPGSNELYEQRWFTSGTHQQGTAVTLEGRAFPFGVDLLFHAENLPACIVGIEICEDLWAMQPPSEAMALAGATLFANPSASTETLGKAEYRR